jgi:hypothetical protein
MLGLNICLYNNQYMQLFDLCLAWNWEYDTDFVDLLEKACVKQGYSVLQVKASNLSSTIEALKSDEISIRVFFDRASDSDPSFLALEEWVIKHHIIQINPRHQTFWIHDKTAVHLAFLESGISTPYTYLLPSFNSQPKLPPLDLHLLGSQFTIKPATGGGGGEGVVMGATSLGQVDLERRNNPNDKYLLQAQLEPFFFNDRQAWFRVVVCNNVVLPSWWDPISHRYDRVTKEEENIFKSSELVDLAKRISAICKMDLFSSEIAFTYCGQFLVVDYVNDPIDLRLQSSAFDGVPDSIVDNITSELVTIVHRNLS